MEPSLFQPSMMLAILPEIGLVVLAAVVLALDLIWRAPARRNLGWVTAAGLLVVMALTAAFARPTDQPQLIFGGMLRFDGMTFVFRFIFLMGAAVTALFMMDRPAAILRPGMKAVNQDRSPGNDGEFYALLLIATLGMNLMAASADLVMLYLAIETTSLPLYVMAGFLTRDPRSTEAGIKYFLFGALTAAIMLYGFSLIFGLTGTTNLYAMADLFSAGKIPAAVPLLTVALVLVGFGFKVSAVPFHFWAPDVYEGAPTPVAGFLSTASKAAGFAVLLRVMLAVFPQISADWTVLVAVLSAVSMIVGNVLAMVQKNIKRLLAYSSIAQAGYMLAGIVAAGIPVSSKLASEGVTFYLLSYLVTNLAAFGIVALVGRELCSDEIDAYAGLHHRNPYLAMGLLVAMLSLGGIPPLSGFVGKLLVFGAAVQAGTLGIILAFIGVITSVIGLYYYLTVVRVAFSNSESGDRSPLTVALPWRVALIVCVALILFMGTVIGPWFSLSAIGASFNPNRL